MASGVRSSKILDEQVYHRFQYNNVPLAIPLVTDQVEKKSMVVRNKNGAEICLKPHYVSRELARFLEASENAIEYRTIETVRTGKKEIAGIRVQVRPADGSNYSSGSFVIIIKEANGLSWANSDIVNKFLSAHGVDVQKQCQLIRIEKEGTCIRV